MVTKMENCCCTCKKMENLRNRINVKLVSNKKDCLKWTSKPSHISHKIFESDLVAICKNKVALILNKPAYIGMSILELSKVLTYEFHYDYIKNKYGNNPRLLFTGTDSLTHKVKTENAFKDFSNDKEMFELIDYSTKLKYYDNLIKLVVGKRKDETTDVVIEEFVRLNTKMYLHLVDDNGEHENVKGISKNLLRQYVIMRIQMFC